MVTVIFEEYNMARFYLDSDYGAYRYDIVPPPFTLTLGESYTVVWDDEPPFTCVAQDMSAVISNAIALGDCSAFGGIGNDEPFIIAVVADAGTSVLSFDTEQTSHTLAIYQGEVEEEPTGVDVILKDYKGTDIVYPRIKAVKLKTVDGGTQTFIAAESAEKTTEADFSKGNMVVKPDAGTLLEKVTVTKPDTLTASNIRNGVNVAGVTGEFIGDTEEKAVTLALANGNQEVTPTEGKVLSKVTITKPDTLLPENIVKDVDIAGVVGTFEGGGGGGDLVEKDVNFFDYDGTLVASYTIEEANVLTALPKPPAHEGLVFEEWNHELSFIQTVDYKLDVGATYITDDGTTRIDLKLFDSAKLAPTLNFSQTVDSGVTIDWGDGNSETVTGTGNVSATHTYLDRGDYHITLTVAEDCEMGLAHGASSATFVHAYGNFVMALHIGERVSLGGDYSLSSLTGMQCCTIPAYITTLGTYAFNYAYALKYLTVPKGVTSLLTYFCYSASLLECISIPTTCYLSGTDILYNTKLRRFVMPSVVTSTSADSFKSNSVLEEIVFSTSGNLRLFGLRSFQSCNRLQRIEFPEGVSTFYNYAFGSCTYLKVVVMPSTVTPSTSSIGTGVLGSSSYMLMYVPDAKLSSYQALSSLSSCKTRMFPISELNE